MPQLCFKTRFGAKTAQLVCHTYCPKKKRSRTETIGSLRLDADPAHPSEGLRLRPGQTLTGTELEQLSTWLRTFGDKDAANKRLAQAQEIEARVRAELAATQAAEAGDVLARAAAALTQAVAQLPALAAQARENAQSPWAVLRPRYLAVHAAWQSLVNAAQGVGVAKRTARTKRTGKVSASS